MADKKEAPKDLSQAVALMVDRYRWSMGNLVFVTLVLFMVMLFFEDLPSKYHPLVAALIAYNLLVALVVGVEVRIIAMLNTWKWGGRGARLLVISLCWFIQAAGFVLWVIYACRKGLM